MYLADIEVYDIDSNLIINTNLSTKSYLKLRKSHIALSVGNQMFVHGGISENNEYLNDIGLLSYNPLKWNLCNIAKYNELNKNLNTNSKASPTNMRKRTNESNYNKDFDNKCYIYPSLAYHSAALVIPYSIRSNAKFSIYKYPDSNILSNLIVNNNNNNNNNIKKLYLNKIKEKGIYLFGGKHSDELYNKDVYVVKTGKKPLEIIKLNCLGKYPPSRVNCSTTFYEEGNILIIFGGQSSTECLNNEFNLLKNTIKNSNNKTLNKSSGVYHNNSFFINSNLLLSNNDNDLNNKSLLDNSLNDLWVLELNKLEFSKIPVYFEDNDNNILYKRHGHSSILTNDKKLIIFGGMNKEGYLGSHLLVIDMLINKRKNNFIDKINNNIHYNLSSELNVLTNKKNKLDNCNEKLIYKKIALNGLSFINKNNKT